MGKWGVEKWVEKERLWRAVWQEVWVNWDLRLRGWAAAIVRGTVIVVRIYILIDKVKSFYFNTSSRWWKFYETEHFVALRVFKVV